MALGLLESIKLAKSVFTFCINMTGIHSATLKVIQGGRITIPTEVRELENIQEGDYVRITIEKVERKPK